MIWGIVLIPIGLLMAIGIVIFLSSLITIVRFRRRHGFTQPLMWWDAVPRDRTSPSSYWGRSVAWASHVMHQRACDAIGGEEFTHLSPIWALHKPPTNLATIPDVATVLRLTVLPCC